MGGFTTAQLVGDPSEKPLRDGFGDHSFPGPRVLTSLAWIEGDASTTPEELPALVRAYRSQFCAAARTGCRAIEHATYATREDVEPAAAAGPFISSQVSLVVQNYLANKARYLGVGNDTEEGMATMARDLAEDHQVCAAAVHAPNAKVAFSTDATAGAHGRNAEEFIGRVEHCGQSPMAALVSANAVAADALGMAGRLRQIAPGYGAVIIARDGDPLADLTALRRVVFVIRGGVVYKWTGSARRGN